MNTKEIKLLRTPEAVDGASQDPLDENVNDVNIEYPILPSAYYSFTLEGCKVERNKKDTGDNLVVPHRLAEPAQDKRGEPVSPGLVITHRVSITPTDKYTVAQLKANVSRIARAAHLNCSVKELINTPAMLNGKPVKAKVKVNKETEEFPESNGIASYATD